MDAITDFKAEEFCCTPDTAAAAAIKSFDKGIDDWSDQQKAALQLYRKHAALSRAPHNKSLLDKERLCMLSSLFDTMFSRDTLYRIEPTIKLLPLPFLGAIHPSSNTVLFTQLAVNEQHIQHSHDSQLADNIEATLLHQLIHCFFWETCCHRRCDSQKCKNSYFLQLGATGHDGPYLDLARAIERVWAAEKVGDYTLDLGTSKQAQAHCTMSLSTSWAEKYQKALNASSEEAEQEEMDVVITN